MPDPKTQDVLICGPKQVPQFSATTAMEISSVTGAALWRWAQRSATIPVAGVGFGVGLEWDLRLYRPFM